MTDTPNRNPEAADLHPEASRQVAGEVVPDDSIVERGSILPTSFPEAMEMMAVERLSGLSSEANWYSLAAWSRDLHTRFLQVSDDLRLANRELFESRRLVAEEHEKRIIAEQALKSFTDNRTMLEIAQGGGITLVLLGIDNIGQLSLGMGLIVLGALFWGVAFATGRRRLK